MTKTLFFKFPTPEQAKAFITDLEKKQFRVKDKATADDPEGGIILAVRVDFIM
jgi:hypothetical protein